MRIRGQLKAGPDKVVAGEHYQLQLRDNRELDILVYRLHPSIEMAEFEEAAKG